MPSFSSAMSPSPSGVGAGVSDATAAGGAFAGFILAGVQSTTQEAVQCGVDVGTRILSGVLQPFGATGQAVTQLAGAVAKSVGSALLIGVEGAMHIVSAGGKLAGMAASVLLAGIGGAIGLIAGPAGAVFGATLGVVIGAAAFKITSIFGEMLGGIVGAVGKALGAVGHLFSEGMQALITTVTDTMQSALRIANEALTLSQASGMGLNQAANAANNLRGFGIDPGSVPGISNNAWLQTMMQRAYGISGAPGSEENLRSYRERYQSLQAQGPLGLLRAQGMESALGMQGTRGTANLDEATFNRQLERSREMQRAFGMSGDEMRKAGQDFTMLMASVGQFTELLKARFAADLLPWLTRGLDMAIGWVEQNSGRITEGIKAGTTWLIVELPAQMMQMAGVVVQSFGYIMQAMGDFVHGIQANLPALLGSLDALLNGLRSFAINALAIGAMIAEVVRNLTTLAGRGGSGATPMGTLPGSTMPGSGAGIMVDAKDLLGAHRSPLGITGGLAPSELLSPSARGRAVGVGVGALTGAGLGSTLGPLGAIVGAAIGGTLGYLKGAQYDRGGADRARVVGEIGGAATGFALTPGPLPVKVVGAAAGALLGGAATAALRGGYEHMMGMVGGAAPGGAFSEAYAKYDKMFPRSNLAALYSAADGPLSRGLGSASDWLSKTGAGAISTGAALQQRGEQWRSDRQKEMALLQTIANNTAATAKNSAYTNDTLKAIGTIAGQEIDNIAKRTTQSIVSISPSTY